MIVYTNEEGVKQGINPFDHGSAYTDIMKTQALKQALTNTDLPQHLAAVVVMKKNQEPKREFSPLEIKNRHGILRTSARKCGSYIIHRLNRVKVFEYSQSLTGQRKISGSTSNAKTSKSYHFIMRQSVR